jgi:hypothetical protein
VKSGTGSTCKNSNHQSTVTLNTDVLKHCVVRRARFLSEYIPYNLYGPWSWFLSRTVGIQYSGVGQTTSARGALGCLSSTLALKYLCPSPATLNARAWNPRLVGRVELGTSATPLKSQSCALGLDSQIAGTFFYRISNIQHSSECVLVYTSNLGVLSNSTVLEYCKDCNIRPAQVKSSPFVCPSTKHD